MEPMIWAYVLIISLAIMTIFAFIHAHSKRIAKEDMLASNARVLREFKRISIHEPQKIVDYPFR